MKISGRAAKGHAQSKGNKPDVEAQGEDNKNDKQDLEFQRWVGSTGTILGCVGGEGIEPCSISIIPEHLRESNKDAYTPKVVSIGPLHRRTKRDLLFMEEMKLRCMMFLLYRTEEPVASLSKCSKAMYNLDEVIRAGYIRDLNFINTYDLAKIMLLDGCYLLELLISNDKKLNDETITGAHKEYFKPRGKVEKDALFDLIALENQIPLIVLYRLLTILFPDRFTMEDGREKADGSRKEKENSKEVVNRLALSLFVQPPDDEINTDINAAHLLELLHSFVIRKLKVQVDEKEDDHSSSTIDVDGIVVEKRHAKLALKRCATELEAAGVKIKTPKTVCTKNLKQASLKYGVLFDFDIKFKNRRLEIPPLHITEATEAVWRKFIAWEQNRCERAQFVQLLSGEDRISCEFSWYALFIQGLICCEHDIKRLKDRGVILVDDDLKLSNKDLLLRFNDIAKGVDKINRDSNFGGLFQDLNKHSSSVNRLREKLSVFCHYFRRLLTTFGDKWNKSYAILRKEYTPTVWKRIGIAYAIMLLLLTIAQLVFQVISI